MKIVLALLAVAVTAQAAPHTFYTNPFGFTNYGAVSPLTYSHLPAYSPLTYSHIPAVAPLTYAVAPAVHPGYVAKTPGATHVAPLPAGLGYASHHVNLAAAPGTK